MKRVCLSLAVLLAACSPGEPAPLRVEVATTEARATWLQDPDLEGRTLAVAKIAAEQWGSADLDGWTVRFVTEIERCGTLASGDQAIMGCTDQDRRTIQVRIDAELPCVESTALLHEIGHVALPNDQGHSDPRWSSGQFWYGMLGALEGEIGQSDASCAAEIAAWQRWWGKRGG
jgi:hypothetical protein